jgi:hypothetical protein
MTHIEIETSKVKGIIMKTVKIMPCLDGGCFGLTFYP